MAITLSSLQTRVRRRFEQATTVRLSDARLTKAINEGVEELAEISEYYEAFEVVNQMGGRTYYDLRGILSPNALKVTGVYSSTTQQWLKPRKVKDFGEDRWELTTGDARDWFVRGLFTLGVYPHSTASSGTFTVYYKAVPQELSAAGDVVSGLPRDYSEGVEEYALYELFVQEGLTDSALQHFTNFTDIATALRAHSERRLERARTGHVGGRM